jgi:hypothetical protein
MKDAGRPLKLCVKRTITNWSGANDVGSAWASHLLTEAATGGNCLAPSAIALPRSQLRLCDLRLRSVADQAEIDAGRGPTGALTTSEREELGQLRRENQRLRMELIEQFVHGP